MRPSYKQTTATKKTRWKYNDIDNDNKHFFFLHCIQLPLLDNTREASSQSNSTEFSAFPLPPQPGSFCTVLTQAQMERFSTMVVSKSEAEALEKNTRQQSSNSVWHHVRSVRLTSSSFKRIFSRRADFEQLATIMQRKKKNIMTKAMKRGLELEPAAAARYTAITGNEVQACGFVINPHVPYLGASPDRRVRSENETYGLLEIKCPMKISCIDCQYLKHISDDMYKLNRTHEYYFQIMGQLGITGMPWCDLFVSCESDYHLERICFDPEMWRKIKEKLDWYFFGYFLPKMCNEDPQQSNEL